MDPPAAEQSRFNNLPPQVAASLSQPPSSNISAVDFAVSTVPLQYPPIAMDTTTEPSVTGTHSLTREQAHLSRVAATVPYSYRAPSPPRVTIPNTRDDERIPLPAFNGVGYSDEDRRILEAITSSQLPVTKLEDWKYELRRTAQPMTSFLYLGPSAAARDIELLKREGITMLLVIRNTQTANARLLSGNKVAAQLGIQSAAVDVEGNQELIAAFPKAVKIINNHLIRSYRQSLDTPNFPPGKVLVFCESGNERSAAVVVAYLMNTFGADIVTAVQYVTAQRFCVALDDAMKYLLHTYQDILQAQRGVSSAPAAPPVNHARNTQTYLLVPNQPTKRGREEAAIDEDGDMDLDYDDDRERFAGRQSFTPFEDRED